MLCHEVKHGDKVISPEVQKLPTDPFVGSVYGARDPVTGGVGFIIATLIIEKDNKHLLLMQKFSYRFFAKYEKGILYSLR